MIRLLVVLLATTGPVQAVRAAEIFWAELITEKFVRAYDEPSFGDPLLPGTEISFADGPNLRVEGRIEPGDNDKLSELLSEELPDRNHDMFNNVVVSFDSEGGDFYEGLALSDTIADFAVTTFVGPGDMCLSSCAIAFLGGQNVMTRGNPPWPKRYLHEDAIVGFHAPFSSIPVLIPVPDGTPLTKELTGQLAGSFYGQAQSAINEIARRMLGWDLSPDFVFEMLTKRSFEADMRPIAEQFLLINSYKRLEETSSVLVTSKLRFPGQITIAAAHQACLFLTFVNAKRNVAAMTYEMGVDEDSYSLEGLISGLGRLECDVFRANDGRWQARTFNSNIHFDREYGTLNGTDWTPTGVVDYEKPYSVSEFVALGPSGEWSGKTQFPIHSDVDFPAEVYEIDKASFDCDGDLDPAAEIICDYPGLAAWDGRMVALYSQARDRFGRSVRDDQREWIATRSRFCRPERMDLLNQRARNDLANCLYKMTLERTGELLRQLNQ